MGWQEIIQIIINEGLTVGIPLAEKLYALFTSKAAPTAADFDALRVIAQNTAQSKMLAALIRAGIDPASDQGKALLALAP